MITQLYNDLVKHASNLTRRQKIVTGVITALLVAVLFAGIAGIYTGTNDTEPETETIDTTTTVTALQCHDTHGVDELTENGTADDPVQISSIEELQCLDEHPDVHAELTSDIDATGTSEWNDGDGFQAIGDTEPFTGELDGNGHEITGLTINGSSNDHTGMIGFTAGTVTNVTISDADVTGDRNTGVLTGYVADGTVESVTVTNSTVTGADDHTGAIAGQLNTGTIDDASVSSTNVTGASSTGGISGWVGGTITDSTVTDSTVLGTGSNTGGIAGYTHHVDDGESPDGASITDVTVTGVEVTGEQDRAAGAVGYNGAESELAAASVSGTDVTGADRAAGLVVTNHGTVSDATFNGTVTAPTADPGIPYDEGSSDEIDAEEE